MDFAILDTESLEVKFISEIVDIKFLINEMKTKNYPTQCIQYYESKII